MSEEIFEPTVAQGLAAIVTSTDDAIVFETLDGRIKSWNPGAEKIYGYTSEEVLGRPDSLLVPADRADEVLRIRAKTAQGEPIDHYETVRVRKDGGPIDVALTICPIRGSDGNISGVATVARDITKQRRFQEELSQQKERIRAQLAELEDIYHYAPVGLCFVDRNLRFVRINEQLAAMNGVPGEAHIGRTIREIVPEIADKVESFCRRVMDSDDPVLNVEVSGVTSAEPGVERHWLAYYVPLRSQAGTVVGVTIAVVEITDRKRAEQNLRDFAEHVQSLSRQLLTIQESERRHLAQELHDEIGQVLSAVSVNLKVVVANVDASARPRLEESIDLVDRALDQVRNLSLDLRPSMLDESGLEAALRHYVDRLAERTGLIAHFNWESSALELPYVVRSTCFRVVQEALTNVVRHGHAKEVWLNLQHQEKEVQLEIRDDGIGFEVADARPRAARSGGLGLMGMRERVELLGGRVDIESRREHGTTVRVRLSLDALPSASEEA